MLSYRISVARMNHLLWSIPFRTWPYCCPRCRRPFRHPTAVHSCWALCHRCPSWWLLLLVFDSLSLSILYFFLITHLSVGERVSVCMGLSHVTRYAAFHPKQQQQTLSSYCVCCTHTGTHTCIHIHTNTGAVVVLLFVFVVLTELCFCVLYIIDVAWLFLI